MATEVKTSDCWLCGHALLCPDGRLRCGDTLSDTEYTFRLAQELCDQFESGGYKIYSLPKQTWIVKPIKVRTFNPRAVKRPIKSKPTASQRLL